MVDRCSDATIELVFVTTGDRVVSGARYLWPSGFRRIVWWRDAAEGDCDTLTVAELHRAIEAGDVRPF